MGWSQGGGVYRGRRRDEDSVDRACKRAPPHSQGSQATCRACLQTYYLPYHPFQPTDVSTYYGILCTGMRGWLAGNRDPARAGPPELKHSEEVHSSPLAPRQGERECEGERSRLVPSQSQFPPRPRHGNAQEQQAHNLTFSLPAFAFQLAASGTTYHLVLCCITA